MMNIFKNSPTTPNIFGAFAYMDRREDNLRKTRDNDPMFTSTFKQMSEQFANNPSSLLRSKGYPKYKKPGGYYNKPGGNQYSQSYPTEQQQSGEGFYKKPPVVNNQELHEMVFVTTAGSKQNKDKKKTKKKKVMKGDSEVYNATGAIKVEIVESSDEEEKPAVVGEGGKKEEEKKNESEQK